MAHFISSAEMEGKSKFQGKTSKNEIMIAINFNTFLILVFANGKIKVKFETDFNLPVFVNLFC